jgi:hypothetical protein
MAAIGSLTTVGPLTAKTQKGFVPSTQFQAPTNKADNTPLAGKHIFLSTGTGDNRYEHTPMVALFAGLILGFTKAKIENLSTAQVTGDSATKNIVRNGDMVVMDIEVGANGKSDIDATATAVLAADGLSYDVTVTGFSDEITVGQDLQLRVYWGYPNA